jgi:hypothetical protein
VKTDVIKPQDIFFNPKKLVVPLFQRPYVWSKEAQWEPLWQDIVRLIEVISEHNSAATHFLGAIVIQQTQIALGSLPTWNVIDGQQRLTTLQLLLAALKDELERRDLIGLVGRIRPLIENPVDNRETEEDRFKLWPTNRDREGFVSVMSASGNPLPCRLNDAYRFFRNVISSWFDEGDTETRAKVLVAAISDRIEIVSIGLDSTEDAQAIFETLNARGTPLSAADLIKNFVFQQVDEHDAENAYLKYWAQFETPWWEVEITSGRIKHSRASLFLSQWLSARTLKEFPTREVFTQFKHYVNTVAKDIGALLPHIRTAADRYRSVIESSNRDDGVLSRIELFSYRVGTLNSEIARPLLIWLDEPEQESIPEQERERVLGILESWFVRRALVKASSQGSNRFIMDLLRHLSDNSFENLSGAVEAFLASNHTPVGYWPGDTEVRTALTGTAAYWKYVRARLRMVFEALEDAQRGYPTGHRLAMGPITRNKGTLEHLMPQKWRRNWQDDLSPEEEARRDRVVQEIGNLTLVTQALNSKVSNGTWQTKRDHFKSISDVLLTNEAMVMGEEGWDEQTITDRTALLISQILEVWPVPVGHVGLEAAGSDQSTVSVDLAQLISDGWLEAGAVLIPSSQPVGREASETLAVVSRDGRIYIGSDVFETPSGAGRAIKGRTVNGWWFWIIQSSGKRLYDLRNEYLQSMGEVDAEVVDEVAPESAHELDDVTFEGLGNTSGESL